ncbi:MAG TPA: hypothetical protein VFH27_17915 [Longimicrobiaceae bacterium]|nr:hypothetical protein [Longimicrobiaceae bacterium]
MPLPPDLYRRLSDAHAEAQRVHDSPVRADQLADKLAPIARIVSAADAPDEQKARIHAELADAERVLRRDDDGREAARHLAAAMRLTEGRARAASPFLDD